VTRPEGVSGAGGSAAVEAWCHELGTTPQQAAEILNKHVTTLTEQFEKLQPHQVARVGDILEVCVQDGPFRVARCVESDIPSFTREFEVAGFLYKVVAPNITCSRFLVRDGEVVTDGR